MKGKKAIIAIIVILLILICSGAIYVALGGKINGTPVSEWMKMKFSKNYVETVGNQDENRESLDNFNLTSNVDYIEIEVEDTTSTEGVKYKEALRIEDSTIINELISRINDSSEYQDFEKDFGAGGFFEGAPILTIYLKDGKNLMIMSCDDFSQGDIEKSVNIMKIFETDEDGQEINTIYKVNSELATYIETLSELKSAIQKYFDIRQILASDTLNVLVELGLKTTTQNSDDYEGFSYDKPYSNSYFLITDVSYSGFENAISKYMTLDLFNSQYPDYVMNKDGVLCIYSEGGTSGSMTVKELNISNTNSGSYICDVTITRHVDDDGSDSEEKFTITAIEKDGKYVVSKCQ